MKKNIAFGVFALVAGSLLGADSDPKVEVKAAIKKLADSGGYSWKTTPSAPRGGGGGGGGRFRPGLTEGQAAKDGVTHLSMTRGENTIEAYLKEKKGALKTEDGWKSLEEASQSDGQPNPTTFLARMLSNFKAPAAEAEDLLTKTKDLKKDEGAYSGDLTEEGVKQLLARGPRRPGADAPNVEDPKGSVKFWVKDGVLSKYEYKVQGKMNFNGNDINIDRTTIVEVKDVGSTKFDVPEEAKKKLS